MNEDPYEGTWWDRLTRPQPAESTGRSRPLFSRREYRWFLASVVFALSLGVVIGLVRWELAAGTASHASTITTPSVTTSMLTVIVAAPTLSPSITETWIRLTPAPTPVPPVHTWVITRPRVTTHRDTPPVAPVHTYPRWTPPSVPETTPSPASPSSSPSSPSIQPPSPTGGPSVDSGSASATG